jgi:hypothetical protein
MSGFLLFFRFPGSGFRRRQPSVWCSDVISIFGRQLRWLHQTLLEVPSSLTCRLQSRVAVTLCDLAMLPCPRTVLFTRLAEPVGLARECQARGRGSPRQPWASPRRRCRSQSGCPINRQGSGRRVLYTPWRSQTQPSRTAGVLDAGSSPDEAREAPGSPALLPEDRRNRSRSKAVWRLSLESTARPS